MADANDQSAEELAHYVRVANLPFGIAAKEITDFFDSFGTIVKLHLKRRVSKNSDVYLLNPHVTLIFDRPECVDEIMQSRPVFLGDCKLFIRRCLPITRKYPQEPFITVKKILIHTLSDDDEQVLPDDEKIAAYLAAYGENIDFYEKLNNKNVIVQFDDYDPVDLCCLSRPHVIDNQQVEIEKCIDEVEIRYRIHSKEKSNSTNNQTMETISPTPILSVDDQITQLRSTHNDMINRLEREHEQLIASLLIEWKQTAKDRIRFQRLTLDYQQEHQRITKENRKWQKLFSDSLKEKPIVQTQGEEKLKEASQKVEVAKAKYDQLIQNFQQ